MPTLRKGEPTKKGPTHQNAFAFKHNKHSRKTEQIKAMPIAGISIIAGAESAIRGGERRVVEGVA